MGNIYSLLHLEDFQHGAARELMKGGFQPRSHPVPPGAISVARTEDQRLNDSWGALELEPDLSFTRWGLCSRSRLRFDRPVPPGRWELHLIGNRAALPAPETDLSFVFHDERETMVTVRQDAGPVHLRIPFRLSKPQNAPVLETIHPVWRPADHLPSSGDHRPLTFQFHVAWLQPLSGEGETDWHD